MLIRCQNDIWFNKVNQISHIVLGKFYLSTVIGSYWWQCDSTDRLVAAHLYSGNYGSDANRLVAAHSLAMAMMQTDLWLLIHIHSNTSSFIYKQLLTIISDGIGRVTWHIELDAAGGRWCGGIEQALCGWLDAPLLLLLLEQDKDGGR